MLLGDIRASFAASATVSNGSSPSSFMACPPREPRRFSRAPCDSPLSARPPAGNLRPLPSDNSLDGGRDCGLAATSSGMADSLALEHLPQPEQADDRVVAES